MYDINNKPYPTKQEDDTSSDAQRIAEEIISASELFERLTGQSLDESIFPDKTSKKNAKSGKMRIVNKTMFLKL